ncbi:hypothetical protein [Amycolatopsis sp. NPDC050768]|uniref:hypothetical protein n=1 Tax=Amycolatopsis sp. NPDC050768 TaxID=3154839 RepID=UPI0033EDA881
MVDKTDTIRVWEPDPKTPAVNLPRGADRKLVLRAVGRTLVATVMTLGGIALFFAGIGVAARLPDGRWLHFTLSAGSRTQLAGQRRLWLIRNGDRAIVALPGAPAAGFGHLNDEPIAGAAELPVVLLRPVFRNLALSAVAAALAVWTIVGVFEHRSAGWPAVLTAALAAGAGAAAPLVAILRGLTVLGIRRTLRRDSWTELPAQNDLVEMPDGRTARIDWAKAGASTARITAASKTLWIYGHARPGVPRAGTPGFPGSGNVRLKLVKTHAK